MNEIWKPIPGYEEKYEVSNLGRVRSLARSVWCHGQVKAGYFSRKPGRVLRPSLASTGYPCVVLGRGNTQNVHVLVARAFLGPCPAGCEVRHQDSDRQNPRADNLQYGTRRQNIEDARRHGSLRRGHEHRRKLAQPMRELACRLYSSGGFTQAWLTRLFNVSGAGMLKILRCGI